MRVDVRVGGGASLQRPRRSPGLHLPRGQKIVPPSLWWIRPPSFLAGVGSLVDISGRRAVLNHRRFHGHTDATTLAGDFRMVASDFGRAEAKVLAQAGQQQLFDPDA